MQASEAEFNRAVRPAVHAGRFYPAAPTRLLADVEGYLAGAVSSTAGPVPKAVIVPHAGYVFSGPVAASGYARLRSAAGNIRRVVLLGPAHYVSFNGLAMSRFEHFATPLGWVPVDAGASRQLESFDCVHPINAAHQPEHSLEVQLPFLQVVLGEFSIVPLLVGRVTDDDVRGVLEALWGGPETLIVVSSDLSHYHDYPTARALDRVTAQDIEAMRVERVADDSACGSKAIRGLLRLVRGIGLRCTTVDLRNSGDTAGARDRVVGYGAFLFTGAG